MFAPSCFSLNHMGISSLCMRPDLDRDLIWRASQLNVGQLALILPLCSCVRERQQRLGEKCGIDF